MMKKRITDHLKALNDIEGVNVRIRGRGGTIDVTYQTQHSLDFKFIWYEDHFVGYFVDNAENWSQAVISLWNAIDAVYFVTGYIVLTQLRAARR